MSMNNINKLNQDRLKEILLKLELNFHDLIESNRTHEIQLTFHPISETNDSNNIHSKISNSFTTSIFIFPTWIIQGLCETTISVEQLLQQNTPPASLVEPNYYEGGTQLWECSYDMNYYLTKHIHTKDLLLPYFNILELGCGYAIPSIAILLFRCYHQLEKKTCIVFQDLNKNALEFSTLPSLFFSLKRYYSFDEILHILITQCEFIYGSWESLASKQHLPVSLKLNHKNDFNLILSCEGLYREINYKWLQIILFKNLSTLKHSKAIFATKRYYFGIGGGSYQFLHFLEHSNMTSIESQPLTFENLNIHLSHEDISNNLKEKEITFHKNGNEKIIIPQSTLLGRIVYTFQDGRSNIRDILIVEHVS